MQKPHKITVITDLVDMLGKIIFCDLACFFSLSTIEDWWQYLFFIPTALIFGFFSIVLSINLFSQSEGILEELFPLESSGTLLKSAAVRKIIVIFSIFSIAWITSSLAMKAAN